ncbi:MAG: hypothetical protein A2107_10930 [Verrucomicrobia bacterium GWF2_62_7]|nr:MAG: hypothetical protein A2107_10930 [Verrucomicrobia bacterium GWF2_62_7]
MNPRVKAVQPQPDYKLRLTFANGEVRLFDMKPYLDTGIFQALRDPAMFNTVRPLLGSIQWQNEADLCPDTLYERSVPLRPAKTLQAVAEAPAKYTTRRRK